CQRCAVCSAPLWTSYRLARFPGGGRHRVDFLVAELREARQRQHLARGAPRLGEPPLVSAEHGLIRHGEGIVHPGPHAQVGERLGERVALRVADGEEVIDVPRLPTLHREPERQVAEEITVPGREPSSALRPLPEPSPLDAEDGRLELVEPARVTELHVAVAAAVTVVPEPPHALRDVVTVGQHHPPVAARAEVLRRIERDARRVSPVPNWSPAHVALMACAASSRTTSPCRPAKATIAS